MESKQELNTDTKTTGVCPVCSGHNLQPVMNIPQVPVLCNVLWDSKAEALAAPRADIRLAFCHTCGHLFNQDFDPERMNYDAQYENSLHFSPKFQQYADWLAKYLVNQHDLHGKSIVEIGSGKGDFLRLLCEYGGNVGTGFDPSYSAADDKENHPAMSFVEDEFSQRYADYQADFICSRHTVEHLSQPSQFVSDLRETIGNRKRTVVYVEVPNLNYILRDTAIWDIIYEHHSYFSANSLATLFVNNSFNVLKVAEAFSGQFLYLEAIPRDTGKPAPNTPYALPVKVLAGQVSGFVDRSQAKIMQWRNKLERLAQQQKKVVIWGAGSKGISFLNLLGAASQVEYAVDINPRKRGKFITGAGQQIIPPENLREYHPDTVILMNPIYHQEVVDTVQELGLEPEVFIA